MPRAGVPAIEEDEEEEAEAAGGGDAGTAKTMLGAGECAGEPGAEAIATWQGAAKVRFFFHKS